MFGDNGLEQAFTLRAALPGSDVEYYRADYDVEQRLRLGERWTLRLRGQLGYGAAYGSDTTSLPPHLNWFAGGPRTVRGYRDDGLGPRDSLGNPYGGDTLLAGQIEVMTAWPQRWDDSVRVGFFYDAGNVFHVARRRRVLRRGRATARLRLRLVGAASLDRARARGTAPVRPGARELCGSTGRGGASHQRVSPRRRRALSDQLRRRLLSETYSTVPMSTASLSEGGAKIPMPPPVFRALGRSGIGSPLARASATRC